MGLLTVISRKLVFTLFFCLLFAGSAAAVDKIDTDFGRDGFSVQDFGFGDDEALALAVQADGKYIVAGYSSNGAVANMAVARYLASGVLDISFNYDGVFLHSMGAGDSVVRSVAVQNDGRIFVAGSFYGDEPALVILALTPDGYLDSAFGDNGQISFAIDGEEVNSADFKVAADGSIVVGATIKKSDSSHYVLFAKVDSSGHVVESFGDAGIVRQDGDTNTELQSLVLLDSGKILAAGAIEVDGKMQAGLLRRNADGTSDTTFADNGRLLLELEGDHAIINDIWLESKENILLAGFITDKDRRRAFALRLTSDGVVDTDFSDGEGIFYGSIENENVANAITVQEDGTIVLAGFSVTEQGKDVIIWSLPGQTGETQAVQKNIATRIITDMGSDNDLCYAMAALPSGQILVAGSSSNGSDKDFALVRYTSKNVGNLQQTTDSVAGVITGRYSITTNPVTDITRVGAVSGGIISDNYHGLSCETSCNARCSGQDEASCYDTCFAACQATATVELRGVCYNVIGSPVYNEESSDTVDDTASQEDSSAGVFPAKSSDSSFIHDIVRSGQTEDGSGLGTFMSDVQDITPNVTYYLRAYAVMPDGSVIYGNEVTFKTEDACFIATAAYGSFLDGHVALLREFRDTYLMHSTIGRKLVSTYYHFSPPIAAFIRENTLLRGIVRILLCPFVLIALFLLRTTLAVKFVGIVVSIFIMKKIKSKSGRRRLSGHAGFTLIELLVVLVIIGILAGYIGPKIMGHPEEAKRTKAALQIQGLEMAIKMYRLDNGMYPSTEQGLQALVEPPSVGKLPPKWRQGGYLEKARVPLDPWKHEFIYLSPGVNGDFDISSYGIDGEAGGEGDAKDINNWEIE